MMAHQIYRGDIDVVKQEVQTPTITSLSTAQTLCTTIFLWAAPIIMILQKPTNITTPIVEVLKKEDALDHDDRILIKVPYTKGLDGTNQIGRAHV